MIRSHQLLLLTTCLAITTPLVIAAGPEERETIQRVNNLLGKAYQAEGIEPAPIANDEDFLRRVTLDLTGHVPTAEQVTLFGLNPDPAKRAKLINDLLEAEEFSSTWGSYWRDVVFMRATEQRARIVQPVFENWMNEQFEKGRSWGQITRDLLTANGPIDENGATGLIFAHTGDPQELTSEVSRIFMGIQISCANCHDHPTDAWKREQFHNLAAFLPRVSVRREDPQNPRSFVVGSVQGEGNRPGQRFGNFEPGDFLKLMDRNRDGKLSKSEARGPIAERFDEILARADKNKDGLLSGEELKEARPPMNEQPGRGALEYFMPDLQDPTSKGKEMQPVFFIKGVPGPKLPSGASDADRRAALADYITSKSNPWFAKAFVNRVWAEMLGAGFYMPIDDMGPERQANHAEVLDVLASGFIKNNYDIRWVYRTIANTDAYQRSMRGSGGADAATFASSQVTRLRSDQLYYSLTSVLGGNNLIGRTPLRRPGGGQQQGMPGPGEDPGKFLFSQLFGFDPSTPQEDLIGNVPQALFMMNSPLFSGAISANGNTKLARIVRAYADDQDALSEVYLMALSREPSDKELQINRDYIATVGNRSEAYEDILWTLLNSTEFQSKR